MHTHLSFVVRCTSNQTCSFPSYYHVENSGEGVVFIYFSSSTMFLLSVPYPSTILQSRVLFPDTRAPHQLGESWWGRGGTGPFLKLACVIFTVICFCSFRYKLCIFSDKLIAIGKKLQSSFF